MQDNADKGYTEDGVKVLSRAQRDWLRQMKAFKDRNTDWNKAVIPGTPGHRFNAYSRVGKLAEVIAQAQPKNYDEWANYYLEFLAVFKMTDEQRAQCGDNPSSATLRKIGWKILQEQAREWYLYCISHGIDITPEHALAQHIIHVVDQTYEGWEREELAAAILTKLLGCEIGRPAYEWDVDYAIDLIKVDSTAPDGFIEGFQIKPPAFFASQRQGVVWARKANAKKHKAAEGKGKRVWFVDGDALARGDVRMIHWTEIIQAA